MQTTKRASTRWSVASSDLRARTRAQSRYSRYAKATFKKDRRLSIRISTKHPKAIQKRALEEGVPYQTLIASLLHTYASGRLREA